MFAVPGGILLRLSFCIQHVGSSLDLALISLVYTIITSSCGPFTKTTKEQKNTNKQEKKKVNIPEKNVSIY